MAKKKKKTTRRRRTVKKTVKRRKVKSVSSQAGPMIAVAEIATKPTISGTVIGRVEGVIRGTATTEALVAATKDSLSKPMNYRGLLVGPGVKLARKVPLVKEGVKVIDSSIKEFTKGKWRL